MFEMKILIILSLFVLCKISDQQPDLCKGDNLFRMNDRHCYSFSEICFKTGDDQCNQILNACKQCPPSNLTLTILRNILEMSIAQSNLTQEIINKKTPNAFEQFTSTMTNKSKESSPTLSNDSCAILLWIIIIILVVHFLEIRFKLFTKCFQVCKTKGKRKKNRDDNIMNSYELKYESDEKDRKVEEKCAFLKSRKRKYLNDIDTKINKLFELNENTAKELTDIKKNVESLSKKISDHIHYLQNHPLATPQKTIKFLREGIKHKYVELYVHINENIVHVKQRLCASVVDADEGDYKRMQLKCNETILNDNDYLLKQIDSSTNYLNYIFNKEINTSEILVVKLKGKMCLPKILQLHKNTSIENLFLIIGGLIGTRNFRVYKCDENKKYMELSKDNNKTVNDFSLTDGDFVNVVTIENCELKLKSIFNENLDDFTVKYSNIDKISTFLKDLNNKNDFILCYSKKFIDEDQFIFHFDFTSDSQVKFCQFKKYENINLIQSIFTGFKWEIYFAEHNSENILIKKYDINVENLKNEVWVLNELKTFLITKSHRRFIQLNNVYKDNESFYISMENMPGGTLSYYLKKNKEFDSIQIFIWAAQILEGLDFLHKNDIIHRDLNPYSILVDHDKSLKLSNFNLSKYNEDGHPCSIIGKDEQLTYIKLRYMAPEILDSREYTKQCDVWSFGAVLVRIVTGKKPYPTLSKKVALNKIINSDKIEYNLPNKFDIKIKSFIDSCFDKNPSSRRDIQSLVVDEMIKDLL